MELTYTDLAKMPLPKLRELGLEIGKIHGVHGMNKQELIEAICEIKGLVDESKVAAEKRRQKAQKDIGKIKAQYKKLRAERDEKRPKLSRSELDDYRNRLRKLKRQTRRLAQK